MLSQAVKVLGMLPKSASTPVVQKQTQLLRICLNRKTMSAASMNAIEAVVNLGLDDLYLAAFALAVSFEPYFRARALLFLAPVVMLERKLRALLPRMLEDASLLGDCNQLNQILLFDFQSFHRLFDRYCLQLIDKIKSPDSVGLVCDALYFSTDKKEAVPVVDD